MDPNLMKFLEEDEDETMHSRADVEAFTAALNRDIGGNASTSQKRSNSNSAALSQGSTQTESQFLQQWQTSSHDGIGNFQSGQAPMFSELKQQHSSQLELQQLGSDCDNLKKEDDSPNELNGLPLPSNQSTYACPHLGDNLNRFPVSRPMGMQTSGEQSLHIHEPGHEPNPERELQMHKLQDTINQQSVEMWSNNQQPTTTELSDQQPWSTGKANLQLTSVGLNNEQAMVAVNQHTVGMGMSSQQVLTLGISNQQSTTSTNQQPGTMLKLNKQVSFAMLLRIIEPQLDKDRAMQVHTLFFRLKKNEISKDCFFRHMRSIVGDQMLKLAAYKLQTQDARNSQTAPNQFQSQAQVSTQQLQISSGHITTDLSNPASDSNTVKLREAEKQADSLGMQTSFPTYGSAGSSYSPSSAAIAASSASLRLQPHDSQMRQTAVHHSMIVSHMGSTTPSMNMKNMSNSDRSHSFSDPKKMQAGTLTPMNSSAAPQQSLVQWPSSTSKEQKICVSSSMTYIKQESVDQPNEQHHKAQMPSAEMLSSSSSAQIKPGNVAPGNLIDDSVNMQPSRMGFTPPASMVLSNSVFSSSPRQIETSNLSNSWMPSLTSPIEPGNSSKAPPKRPLAGQKKPMEAPDSSPPPSSKKQKVSGALLDQSIEQLNDVTAVSGVNIREEEEHLFSGPKEESQVSEASRRVVQEEEERLILQKIPLQKKVGEIMAQCGLKTISNDVERCLSLCVEERMRGLISDLIRLSKQHVDIEKSRHRTIITSDVRQQIMTINSKAREELERKQAATENSQKLNEPQSTTGVDGEKEKDESCVRSTKPNKEEDDKMRTTAANVAVRAATGVGDMLSRWQLMIEAKQKQGGTDTLYGSEPGKDAQKPLQASTRNACENQEAEMQDHSADFDTPAVVRKIGRNQVMLPRISRSITVKDVIAILEREPQMSKSTLIYRLYDKVSANVVGY